MVDLNKKCSVYWIRRPDHTDMFMEGYIGVTTNSLHKRMTSHKSAARKGAKTIIAKAIRKHQDLICTEILVAPLWYCLEVENKLRPFPGIGYNMAEGGFLGRQDVKTSKSTLERLSESIKMAYILDPTLSKRCGGSNKGRKHSEQTKQKLRLRKKQTAWNNSASSKEVWLDAVKVYDYVTEHGCGHVKVALHFKVAAWTYAAVVKKIKTGWNPHTCPEWQEFYDKNTKEN